MSMDVDEIAKVLAEHLWHHTAKTHCACGFRAPLAQLAVESYCAHLAAVLAPLVEQAWQEGAREAWDEGVLVGLASSHQDDLAETNPYAERAATPGSGMAGGGT